MLKNESPAQLCTQPNQLQKESLKKKSGLDGIQTHDPCDADQCTAPVLKRL